MTSKKSLFDVDYVQAIYRLCRDNKMNKTELAAHIHVDIRTISKLNDNPNHISFRLLKAVCEGFKITQYEFMTMGLITRVNR